MTHPAAGTAGPAVSRAVKFAMEGASVSNRAAHVATRSNLAKAKVETRTRKGTGGCASDAVIRPGGGRHGSGEAFEGFRIPAAAAAG